MKVKLRGRQRAWLLRTRIKNGATVDVVIDVDGCLTDGTFVWTNDGKAGKMFGPDDHQALHELVATGTRIHIVTGDKLGFELTAARIYHMGFKLTWMPSRWDRITQFGDPHTTVYIGDGYYDAEHLRNSAFGIVPCDAWPGALKAADAVTSRPGGHRAVAEAVDWIMRRLL